MPIAKPNVGCFVLLRNGKGELACLLRQNTGWMDGFYGSAGGKIEQGERYVDAAIREIDEELGISVQPEHLKFVHMLQLNNVGQEEWLHIVFEVTKYSGVPYNKEPDIHSELAWFSPDQLPENLIPSNRHVLEQVKQGIYYSVLSS